TFRAVNDISFSIPTGQIVGLLGPNGAGKSTTMRMITGFLESTGGTVTIDGIDITADLHRLCRFGGCLRRDRGFHGRFEDRVDPLLAA
ncbi:MAG: ATP-binding cassette domain-containing protein, partial [Oscillospiraceae bacterium]|nr:ATP-binding cassette domain-containing protein [Oscillospiraceae bacterium]